MAWPEATDYNEAIQNPAVCFADPELRQGQPEVNAMGWPLPCSGNFAAVYKIFGPNQTAWAVKCFTREVPGLRERYYAISAHLQQAKLPFAVDFQYLEQGIRIRGDWYAVVKMRWIEGFTLNAFLKDHADKPQILERLAGMWLKLAGELRRAGIAHADLQHGNVLLVPGGKSGVLSVRLVDYDGMFVPALARSESGEVGHANYQHPERARLATYDAEVDRFAHLVIYTALRALHSGGRGLWDRYDNGENLLFREQDFLDPSSSALFRELLQMPDPVVRSLATRLIRACQQRIADVPLLTDVLKVDNASEPGAPALRTGAASVLANGTLAVQPCPFCSAQILATARKCRHCGGVVQAEPRVVEAAWWMTAPPPRRGDRPSLTERPQAEKVGSSLRKAALVLGGVALALSFVHAIAGLSVLIGSLGLLLSVSTGFAAAYPGGKGLGIALTAALVNCVAFCMGVSSLGRPSDLALVVEEGQLPRPPVSRPATRLPSSAAREPVAKAKPAEQGSVRAVGPGPEEVRQTEEWLALQARLNKSTQQGRRRAKTTWDYEQKEAARRELEVALQRQREEDRRKAQEAALQRQREQAERAALQRQKNEMDAARKLNQARSFIRDSLEKERKNQQDYAERLMAIAHKRLREIIQLYPQTQAAAECRKLLRETGGEP